MGMQSISATTRKATTAFTLPSTRRALRNLLARALYLRVLLWWGAQLTMLAVYASLRGKMDDLGMPVHGSGLETGIFGSLPTLWLQHHIYTLAPHDLEWAAVIVHGSWFFVPIVAAVFVSIRRPDRIGSFFRWWIALQVLALALFALFPMRPPWMANDEVTRIVALRFGGQIDDPNALAAMPSLHVTFPLMISLWFFRERWKAPAFVMLAYATLIGVEVVFSGEHYVVDVAGACATASFIFLAARINYGEAFRSLRRSFAEGSRSPAVETVLQAARRAHNRQRGQTLIEFSLALPIILLFLLVMVDFGLALDHRIVMQHAVSEGVREAAVSTSLIDIQTTASDQSQGLVNPADVSVCYIDENGNGYPGDIGDKVRVSASYTYQFTAGGGEMLQAFGVSPPSITMEPIYTTALQTEVTGAPTCS
jgi:hypothetical protein